MINKKRKYSSMKLNGAIGTALHQAVDRWNEAQGCTLKTGGEIDFIKMDRAEIKRIVIDRNRRKLDKLVKNLEVQGMVDKLLGPMKQDLNSPKEPKPDG